MSVPRPSYRWKDGNGFTKKFWTLNTKHGVKYMCKECGRQNLGINFSGRGMHWKSCSQHPDNKQD